MIKRILFQFRLFMMGYKRFPKHTPKLYHTCYVYSFGRVISPVDIYRLVGENDHIGIKYTDRGNVGFVNEKGLLFAPKIWCKYTDTSLQDAIDLGNSIAH